MIKVKLIAISFLLASLIIPSAEAADYLNLSSLKTKLRDIAKVAPKEGEVTSPFFCDRNKVQKPIELPRTKDGPETSELPTSPARESVGAKDAASLPTVSVSEKLTPAKSEVLIWFSKFAKNESLFTFNDLSEMQRQLMSMPDKEFDRWQSETKYLREALDSDEWAATSEWLSQFWKRQAMYKDDELNEFRSQLKQLPPDGVLFVMDHFANQYITKSNRLAFKQTRRAGIGVNAASRTVSQRPTSGTAASYATTSPNSSPRSSRDVITSDHLSSRVSRYYMYRGYNNYFWAYRPLPR